jgi:hypothetical protein
MLDGNACVVKPKFTSSIFYMICRDENSFNRRGDGGVVQIAFSPVHERNRYLLYDSGEWQPDLHGFSHRQGISEVLPMQPNTKAGFKRSDGCPRA